MVGTIPNFFITCVILLISACWGSCLNTFATRGLMRRSLVTPSACDHCDHVLSWLELTPVLSWIILKGQCSYCSHKISPWYPLIECITALWVYSLVITFPPVYLPALLVLSSALIVTIRTDGEHLLILRWCTLGILPIGFIASFFKLLPLSLSQSIVGAGLGTAYLAIVYILFLQWKGYKGLGEGDIELIAAIGAFIGPIKVLTVLIIASCIGILYASLQLVVNSSRNLRSPIPFGVCLALATWATLLLKPL